MQRSWLHDSPAQKYNLFFFLKKDQMYNLIYKVLAQSQDDNHKK